jgi:hypothetical protein
MMAAETASKGKPDFSNIPMLKHLIVAETAEGFILWNNVDISVGTSNYKAVRGRAIALVILDEVAFFASENTSSPDVEVYRALLPGLATLGGKLIGISSPLVFRLVPRRPKRAFRAALLANRKSSSPLICLMNYSR